MTQTPQPPSIARNVHYVPQRSQSLSMHPECWAGIITYVWEDGTVDLTLFPPGLSTPQAAIQIGYDADGETPGTWRWPPRV